MIEQCHKKGCNSPGTITVQITDGNTHLRWKACPSHALAFHEWVASESLAHHESFSASFVPYDEIEWMNE